MNELKFKRLEALVMFYSNLILLNLVEDIFIELILLIIAIIALVAYIFISLK